MESWWFCSFLIACMAFECMCVFFLPWIQIWRNNLTICVNFPFLVWLHYSVRQRCESSIQFKDLNFFCFILRVSRLRFRLTLELMIHMVWLYRYVNLFNGILPLTEFISEQEF